MLEINRQLSIPEDELRFTASRSGGPGGQHVNKVSTRVTLWFDVLHSPSLSVEQRQLILARLPTRINKEGLLWVTAQQSRSQIANRNLAIERFVELLSEALRRKPPRKKTRVPKAAKIRRLETKKRRSLLKHRRSSADAGES